MISSLSKGEARLGGLIGVPLAARVAQLLLAAARAGYCEMAAKYDAAAGWNSQLFGYGVWVCACAHLTRAVAAVGDGRLRVSRPDGSLLLHVEGEPRRVAIGLWKAGEGPAADIPPSGSWAKQRLGMVNSKQLTLAQVADLPELGEPYMLAAVHDGDPQRGLRRMELGAPLTERWQWREVLWCEEAEAQATAPPTTLAEPERGQAEVAFDEQPDAELRLSLRPTAADDAASA